MSGEKVALIAAVKRLQAVLKAAKELKEPEGEKPKEVKSGEA